jgi:hypothetical protein
VSLRQKVRLELEDGTQVDTEYSAIDLRAWEKENKRSALNEPVSVSMLTWLGWSAAKRNGSINGAYDTYPKFDAACVSVEGVGDEEEPVPTKAVKKTATPKVPGPESSAPSP